MLVDEGRGVDRVEMDRPRWAVQEVERIDVEARIDRR
jgi:hypothetical protein